MRGFGVPQAAFAIEGCLDLLAKKAGLDGWEIRSRNAVAVGDAVTTGQVLEKSVGLRKTLDAVKDAYYGARRAGKAVGIACGLKNSGIGNGVAEWGKCRLVVETDGTVSLYNGYTEMGQGLLTVLVQFAVEVTGLPASVFHPKVDSTFALGCGQTTGSRATLFGGRAVTSAARKLRTDLDAGRRLADLTGRVYAADEVVDDTTALGADVPKIKTHTSYGYATQVVILDADGRVDRIVAAHDVGRVVNPVLCRGPDRGLDPHGARLCPHRGAALRERDAGDVEPARDRRPARPRHAEDRGDPRRGARAGGPVRREGRRRDRPRAHRGGGGGSARGLRRRPADDAPHEGLARGPGDERRPHPPPPRRLALRRGAAPRRLQLDTIAVAEVVRGEPATVRTAMMDLNEAKRILAAFEDEDVAYVLVGSMAMAAQGLVRATRDLDFFVSPEEENVARLKRALKSLYDGDPNVDQISAEELAGDYPAVEYVPPHGRYSIDILTRLGEAFRYETLEFEELLLDGIRIRVATPTMLYRMKKGTVRPQDRLDAETIRQEFGLDEET